MRLKLNHFGDPYEFDDSGIYFTLLDEDDKEFWSSSWYGSHDLTDLDIKLQLDEELRNMEDQFCVIINRNKLDEFTTFYDYELI